jgi:hypothetical protein
MNTFPVEVRFNIEATSAADAQRIARKMLHQLNDYDQLPDWEVGGLSDKTPLFYQAAGT